MADSTLFTRLDSDGGDLVPPGLTAVAAWSFEPDGSGEGLALRAGAATPPLDLGGGGDLPTGRSWGLATARLLPRI
jgi:hypothetical protein